MAVDDCERSAEVELRALVCSQSSSDQGVESHILSCDRRIVGSGRGQRWRGRVSPMGMEPPLESGHRELTLCGQCEFTAGAVFELDGRQIIAPCVSALMVVAHTPREDVPSGVQQRVKTFPGCSTSRFERFR